MSRTIGFFVDISDLYAQVKRVYKSRRRLDYEKYLKFVSDIGEVHCAIAYGCQKHNEADGFRHMLEKIGFETKFMRIRVDPKQIGPVRAEWDVIIALDIASRIDCLDTIVLGSSCKALIPAIKWARERGVKVIILACSVGAKMKRAADRVIEIPESLLEC